MDKSDMTDKDFEMLQRLLDQFKRGLMTTTEYATEVALILIGK